MKNLDKFLFIAALFCSSPSLAETTYNARNIQIPNGIAIDMEGKVITGKVVTTDNYGNQLMECNYLKGKPNGYCEKYGEPITLQANSRYGYGNANPTRYILKGNYKNGIADGIVKIYDTISKYIVKEEAYKNNRLDGIVRTFDENGNVIREEAYKNGLREGYERRYFTKYGVVVSQLYEGGHTDGSNHIFFARKKDGKFDYSKMK